MSTQTLLRWVFRAVLTYKGQKVATTYMFIILTHKMGKIHILQHFPTILEKRSTMEDLWHNMDAPQKNTLSERNQTQKATYYVIPFIGNV